jgi:hypothetical protein
MLCRHVPQHEVRAGQQQGKAGHKVCLGRQQRDPRQAEHQPEGAQRRVQLHSARRWQRQAEVLGE